MGLTPRGVPGWSPPRDESQSPLGSGQLTRGEGDEGPGTSNLGRLTTFALVATPLALILGGWWWFGSLVNTEVKPVDGC